MNLRSARDAPSPTRRGPQLQSHSGSWRRLAVRLFTTGLRHAAWSGTTRRSVDFSSWTGCGCTTWTRGRRTLARRNAAVRRSCSAGTRRVMAFDRPGFGYIERPRARLLRRACRRLGVERPVVVGHSWATLVALAWALQALQEVAGLVLASGYYYPSRRLDVALVTPGAVPLLGDVLNHTVSPPLTQMTLPGTLRKMFAPRPVPDRFSYVFPRALIPRPEQIRAMSQEGAIMVPAAAALRRHYGGFNCPSIVMTGDARSRR